MFHSLYISPPGGALPGKSEPTIDTLSIPPILPNWYYIIAGGGAILFLVIVIVMAICCRHLTARRNQPTMAYYGPHNSHYPNGGIHRPGTAPKLTVWVEKGDGNSYWWETLDNIFEVSLWTSLKKQISERWRRCSLMRPNTSIRLFPGYFLVVFFLGYQWSCLTGALRLFTSSYSSPRANLYPASRWTPQEDVLSNDLNHWSWADLLIQCAVLMINPYDQDIEELLWTCCPTQCFALWLVPEVDYEYVFTFSRTWEQTFGERENAELQCWECASWALFEYNASMI